MRGPEALHQPHEAGVLPQRIEQGIALEHRQAGEAAVDGPIQPAEAVVPVAKLRQGGRPTWRLAVHLQFTDSSRPDYRVRWADHVDCGVSTHITT